MRGLYYSENGGETFKPCKLLSEIPTLEKGAIFEDQNSFSYVGECSGSIKLKMTKESRKQLNKLCGKTHTSRKWKKKHGLLKRQKKRLFKMLRKSLNKLAKALKASSRETAKLSNTFLKLNQELNIKESETLQNETL